MRTEQPLSGSQQIDEAATAQEDPEHLLDDETLVRQAQIQAAAFAPLYRRYVGPIFGYCYQRLGSRHAAEDATSQTFERALAALPRYHADSFRGWLYTIARNVTIDHFRQRPQSPLDHAWGTPDSGPLPEQALLEADSESRVRRLLAQLSNDQREVVELDLAGVEGPEIATVLGRSPGAIRAIRFRAYSRLRTLLSEESDL
jgi:RNA polymerase sigma-70 factor (ECF subfamily)